MPAPKLEAFLNAIKTDGTVTVHVDPKTRTFTPVSRLDEYEELLCSLQARYQDVPGPQRAMYLITAAVALTDAFCLGETGRLITEAEFVKIAQTQFRKLRGVLA